MSTGLIPPLVNAVLLLIVAFVGGTLGLRRFEAIERSIADLRTEMKTDLGGAACRAGADTKAGVILGFAGVLVALSPSGRSIPVGLGKRGALTSAFFAISTFWPRRFWSLDVRAARDEYLAVDPRFAELRILDTEILIATLNDGTLAKRGRQLKVAMLALGVAALLVGLGSWLH